MCFSVLVNTSKQVHFFKAQKIINIYWFKMYFKVKHYKVLFFKIAIKCFKKHFHILYLNL